jgi:hypothetical protein
MNPQAAALQARAEAAADIYWRNLPPGISVADAVAMPFSGERNLVLRRALGLDFPGRRGELVKMDKGDVVQVVQRNLTAARRVERLLTEGLDASWTVGLRERSDGCWLVAAYPYVEGQDDPLPELDDLPGS